jgi:hypothetical protein
MPMQEVATMDRRQNAVLWPFVAYDRAGQPIVTATPVGLSVAKGHGVQWTWKRREVLDAKGNTIALDASAVVDQRIDVGSLMWLGKIGDLPPGTSFLGEANELYYVATYNETCDIKGRAVNRTVNLARFRDAMPIQMDPPSE